MNSLLAFKSLVTKLSPFDTMACIHHSMTYILAYFV